MKQRAAYRVAVAGLEARDVRLIDIVFRHAQYNKYDYTLLDRLDPQRVDVLIVDADRPDGQHAMAELSAWGREISTIRAVARGARTDALHSISIERLTLQLLPILNRVVETELLARPRTESEPPVQAAEPRVEARPREPDRQVTASMTKPRTSLVEAACRFIVEGRGVGTAPERSVESADTLPLADPPSRAASPGASALGGATQAVDRNAVRDDGDTLAGPDTLPVVPATLPVVPAASERYGHADPNRFPVDPPSGRAASAAANRRSAQQVIAFPGNALPADHGLQLRVLIVDDSATVQQQLLSAFARFGLEAEAASSGEQALRRLSDRHFDLMTLDIGLPGIDGLTVLRALREAVRWRYLPVIVLSSRASAIDRARGLLAGADVYLAKPVEMIDLHRIVTAELRRSLQVDDLTGRLRPVGPLTRPRLASA